MLVGREGFDRRFGKARGLLGDDLGAIFLKAFCSSAVAVFGLRGRGFWIDQPIARSASQPRCGASEASPSSPAMSSPFFIYHVVVNFAAGLVSRVTPQVSVHYIATPFAPCRGLVLLVFTVRPNLDEFESVFGAWLAWGGVKCQSARRNLRA